MIASSAFVLSALTITGIYMKSNNESEQDDGYMLDFTALEDNVQDKTQEIAAKEQTGNEADGVENEFAGGLDTQLGTLEDDLDYLPMEAGSGQVSIPGLTDGILDDITIGDGISSGNEPTVEGEAHLPAGDVELPAADPASADTALAERTETPAEGARDDEKSGSGEKAQSDGGSGSGEKTEADGGSVEGTDSGSGEDNTQEAESAGTEGAVVQTMHFTESEGLLRPVGGEVLIPFSMDSSVYFSTLDQFKYNPAMMIAAEQGTGVIACAEGVVIDIFEDEEIGHAITMDLGDGYQITYGQLYDINVTMNSHVDPGQIFASVAAPTKYFSVEGSNLYLKLTANGTPVNPEALFR